MDRENEWEKESRLEREGENERRKTKERDMPRANQPGSCQTVRNGVGYTEGKKG